MARVYVPKVLTQPVDVIFGFLKNVSKEKIVCLLRSAGVPFGAPRLEMFY